MIHFKASEFDCKDGTPVPRKYFDNLVELIVNLQTLRDKLGKPIIVNSGYRTKTHNDKVGGSPKSQHLLAKAADIVVPGLMPSEVHQVIKGLIESGEMKNGGLGLYDSFVHYDVRDYEARWVG